MSFPLVAEGNTIFMCPATYYVYVGSTLRKFGQSFFSDELFAGGCIWYASMRVGKSTNSCTRLMRNGCVHT